MANLMVNAYTSPYDKTGLQYQGPNSDTLQGPDEDSKTDRDSEKEPEDKANPGRSNPEECETCKHRKYQDASDEGNVSFKQAAHVSPTAAGAAVRAHEGMHVSNAYNKAEEAGGEVVSAYVTIKTSVCPECGRTYVAGGVTHTQIRYPNESNPYQQGRKAEDAANYTGANADYSV